MSRISEFVRDVAKSRVRGRVSTRSAGQGTYYPPGWRLRIVGDYVAFLGAWGYLIPALAGGRRFLYASSAGYPPVYPGIDPVTNLAILAFAPMMAFPLLVIGVLSERLTGKVGVVVIGLLGTAVTWPMNEQILSGSVYGAGPLLGLSGGSWLVLTGGLLSLLALRFGEWAKQYDDNPKQI